ncbi:GOLPH3/VPS74 family protein [Pseudactinotalea terrae]|uniref:GOLPH3/VPS74 family protein n=1 Tax=Pseudactinotalea terrae TaxID=1743262 RepID=UPI0014790777|nr:GPP34 family phosphoprotein [Pseudactinotalea terrae]
MAEAPTLAEDLMLLLFQPRSGTFAGETTLYYVLAAAVLADLALEERVRVETTPTGTVRVGAVAERAPSDEILRATWDHVADRPRFVQSVLPTVGPQLRQPTVERLIARGDIGQESRRVLGLFGRKVLVPGKNGRRAELVAGVRAVLVEGAQPGPRVSALAALAWASGSLSQLDPEIPWTSAVTTRAQELERGSWGAAAGGEAVVRTMNAIIINSVIVANAALRRS